MYHPSQTIVKKEDIDYIDPEWGATDYIGRCRYCDEQIFLSGHVLPLNNKYCPMCGLQKRPMSGTTTLIK